MVGSGEHLKAKSNGPALSQVAVIKTVLTASRRVLVIELMIRLGRLGFLFSILYFPTSKLHSECPFRRVIEQSKDKFS